MRLTLRPLTLALLLTGFAGTAGAVDLMDAYELARQGDPQLAAAESSRDAVGENVIQSRSALLPHLSGSYSIGQSEPFGDEAAGEARSTGFGLTLNQSIYDHSNWTQLGASRLRADQGDADYKAAADDLVVRTAAAYFEVLTAIETLASSRAARPSWREMSVGFCSSAIDTHSSAPRGSSFFGM